MEAYARAVEAAVHHAARLPPTDRLRMDAWLAYLSGAAAEAAPLYEAVVAEDPTDVEAWFYLAETLFHYGPLLGRPLDQAAEPWRRVVALRPDDVGASRLTRALVAPDRSAVERTVGRLLRARLLAAQGRWHDTERVLDAAESLAPAWTAEYRAALATLGAPSPEPDSTFTGTLSYPKAHENWLRAESLRRLGRHDDALRWYAVIPDTTAYNIAYLAASHLRRAEIHHDRGDLPRARSHYRHFRRLWTDADPELQDRLDDVRRREAAIANHRSHPLPFGQPPPPPAIPAPPPLYFNLR
ncbi:MAG: tetratricopeptide repeat protein [Gemmatimonadota bacterium]